MSHNIQKATAQRSISFLFLLIVLSLGVLPARGDDMFRKLPTLGRSFGDIVAPYPVTVPNGLPLAALLLQPQPNSDSFRSPASTASARPGTDPFTNRPIPAR